MTARRTVAVVLAGGTGTRLGSDVPKQLLDIGDMPILVRALRAFQGCDAVDEIVVMMTSSHLQEARRLVELHALTKVVAVLPGGTTRSATTLAALETLGDEECHVLVHDAARPLVTGEVIRRCADALAEHAAVSTVMPVVDTIYRVDEAGDTVDSIVPRRSLRRAQTPQGFHLSLLRAAHRQAAEHSQIEVTDDCDVVMRFVPGVVVHLVDGDPVNIKVTDAADLRIAASLLDGTGG